MEKYRVEGAELSPLRRCQWPEGAFSDRIFSTLFHPGPISGASLRRMMEALADICARACDVQA